MQFSDELTEFLPCRQLSPGLQHVGNYLLDYSWLGNLLFQSARVVYKWHWRWVSCRGNLQFIWTLVWGEPGGEDIRPSLPLHCSCHAFNTGRANHESLLMSSSLTRSRGCSSHCPSLHATSDHCGPFTTVLSTSVLYQSYRWYECN